MNWYITTEISNDHNLSPWDSVRYFLTRNPYLGHDGWTTIRAEPCDVGMNPIRFTVESENWQYSGTVEDCWEFVKDEEKKGEAFEWYNAKYGKVIADENNK